jgi:hypothetical protein
MAVLESETGIQSGGDDDASFDRTVIASPEEIRYAQQLRLELRESYARRPVPPATLWWVGAD